MKEQLDQMSVIELMDIVEYIKDICQSKIKEVSRILGIDIREISPEVFNSIFPWENTGDDKTESAQSENTIISNPSSEDIPLLNIDNLDNYKEKLSSESKNDEKINGVDLGISDNDTMTYTNSYLNAKNEMHQDETNNEGTFNNPSIQDEETFKEFPILKQSISETRTCLESRVSDGIPKVIKPRLRSPMDFTEKPKMQIMRTGNVICSSKKDIQWGRVVSCSGLIPTILKGGTPRILIHNRAN